MKFTKTYLHDENYDLVLDKKGNPQQTGKRKFVDPKAGQDYGHGIKAPEFDLLKSADVVYDYALHRDLNFNLLPERFYKLPGKYISQLLILGFANKQYAFNGKYKLYQKGSDFMKTRKEFLDIQNGADPVKKPVVQDVGYIRCGRDLASYVHTDSIDPYIHSYYILKTLGVKMLPGFVDGGEIMAWELFGRARDAFKQTWSDKYKYMVARPEEVGGNVEFGKEKPTKSMELCKKKYGTYLLPMAYPEGSPCHPSYPQGHTACIVAGMNMLLALLAEPGQEIIEHEISGRNLLTATKNKVKVHDEVVKMAYNVGLGRVWAGVHYEDDFLNNIEPITNLSNQIIKEIFGKVERLVGHKYIDLLGNEQTV